MRKISGSLTRIYLVPLLLLVLALGGCGAGGGTGEAGTGGTPGGGGGETGASPASIDLLVSSPQLPSDGATPVTLTAVVKDSSNRALEGQTVSFSADSGLVIVTSGTTDANGTATATLGTGGNPTNRLINLTATTGSVSATNAVTVTGTTLSISGLASLSFGDSTPLTISLKDSAGNAISIINGQPVTITVTSLNGNTLSAGPYRTDGSGQATVNVTATVAGIDTITASAIGATTTFSLNVNASILIMNPPTSGQLVNINTWQPVTVTYTSAGNPVNGAAVNFSTTRGALDASSGVTAGTGTATVNVRSTNSGPALISAFVTSGPAAQVPIEFIATTVSTVTLHASPAVIGTNSGGVTTERSQITAVVRDLNDNLVKNKTVNFTIDNDASGGSLSPASAITDSSGTASTYFSAGASPSGLDGVTIRASVVGTAVTGTTTLTVARKAVFITLATGPTVEKLEPNKYKKDYVALVTDAAGNPVPEATVLATVTPMYYMKGFYVWSGSAWRQVFTLQSASSTLPAIPACANEDCMTHNPLYDFNAILDPGEDQNANEVLDPGNVASVTTTTTDSNGMSTLSIVYARDYAYWVNVKLQAFASDLSGSTNRASVTFDLPGVASDYTNQTAAPPGDPSPFGISDNCYVDLTVTPISSSQMAITWQKSATAVSYDVYRDGAFLKNVTVNTTTDTGLTPSTQYCYRIEAVYAGGAANFAGPVCATTNPLPPPVPTGLTAAGGILDVGPPATYKVILTWNASAGAAVYKIYRDGTLVMSVPLTATTATDTAVVGPLHGYCYTISAMDVSGNESAQSGQVCTATPAAP